MPVPSTGFDVDLSLYDDFSRYADNTTMSGLAPIAGANWATTGADLPTTSGGYLVSSGVGYLYSIQSTPVNELGCDVAWFGGSDMTKKPMTLTISPDESTLTLTKMLHFNFGPTGFALSFGDAVGAGVPLQGVTAGNWAVPMKGDGTLYRLKMAVRGNGLVIFGPNGEVFGWSDVRVAQFTGRLCFLEPTTQEDGLQAKVKRTWAVSRNASNPISPFATNDDFASFGNYFFYGRVVGALNRMGEVDIGFIGPQYSFPQIQFGPQNIITSITAATAVNATTISTVDYIPSGTSITIDPGSNQEVVNTSAVSGSGPYTLTVPALTKEHLSGAVVQCAAPSSMLYTVVYNQIAQALQFPVDPQHSVSFGTYSFHGGGPLGAGLYLDSNFSSIITYSNGAIRLGPANAFVTGVNTTANRPSATTVGVGAQFYDSTIHKPIWSDGTSWRDASGNLV